MYRTLLILSGTTAILLWGGCATSSGELVDKKLKLLEAQFSKLEKHTVPRGPAGELGYRAEDPDSPPPLPVVKLHKLKKATGWEGAPELDEPEVRIGGRRQAPRYAQVQRRARGASTMDENGNLVNVDGKVVYRAGTGSPDRAAAERPDAPRRVWEPRPADKEEKKKGIKPMPRLKQFRIGGDREVPLDREENIRVESAPPAPPIPVMTDADLAPEPEPPVRVKRARRAKQPRRVAKKRWQPRAKKKRVRKPKLRRKPVPRIAQAPSLETEPAPAPVRVAKRPAVAKIKPMPKLRHFPKREKPVKRAVRKPKKLVIKRAPGPQRMTRQKVFKGSKERKVQRIYKRAMTAFRNGDDDVAAKDFKQILRHYYSHDLADNALYWLGETTYRQGHWLQALSYFQDIIIRYPDGNKVGDAMVKSALCYAHLGDTSYAQKVLADVESLFPASRLSKVARERRLALGLGDSG